MSIDVLLSQAGGRSPSEHQAGIVHRRCPRLSIDFSTPTVVWESLWSTGRRQPVGNPVGYPGYFILNLEVYSL